MTGKMPELWGRVYGRAAFDTEERARRVLELLCRHRRFAPDRFGEYEPLRALTPERMEQAVSLIVQRLLQETNPQRAWSMVLFHRTRRPRCAYTVSWGRLSERPFEVSFYDIEQDFVRRGEQLEEWLGFAFELLALHDAWYALFALEEERQHKNILHWRSRHPRAVDPQKGVEGGRGVGVRLEEGIPGVYWGNYLGPFYVQWFGRDRLESLPCVEKRWLETGGLFFTTATSPFDWDAPPARELQRKVKEHLGAEAFFDMEAVRQKLALLEPLPEGLEPEQLQPPRRLPQFPFTIEPPPRKPLEEEIAEVIGTFEGLGYELESREGRVVVFRDGRGGVVRVTAGAGGSVEYFPKQ